MNTLLYYLNDEDEPVPTDDPVTWANHPRHHVHVGDEMVGPWRVSTVFLGIDSGLEPGHLVLWETMIFGPEPWSQWQRRYASHAEALNGHAGAVAMLEETRGRDGRSENRADRGRARGERDTLAVDGERSDQEAGNNDAARGGLADRGHQDRHRTAAGGHYLLHRRKQWWILGSPARKRAK